MNDVRANTAALLERHAAEIAGAAAGRLLEQHPAMRARFGDGAADIWTEHLLERVRELCAAVAAGEPELFVSRVSWSRAAMAARGVQTSELEASLESLRAGVTRVLTGAEQQSALECIDSAIASFATGEWDPREPVLDPGLLPDRIALRYIQAVVAGNAVPGMAIVTDAVDDGLSVRDALMKVLLPAQREVGRLWHLNELSVAEEHMVTMTTQRLMAVLAERARRAPDRGRTAVTAAVAGNIHDIGIRAIAYLLEMDGWRSIYLGADVPKSDIPAAVQCFDADIVLLSLALTSQLPSLKRSIDAIREVSGSDVQIMVGGNGLKGAPKLWEELGADGYAVDADQALALAAELVPER